MATNTAPEPLEHPPLARDAHGHLIAVPDGTCAWRICRKTSGRPKEILGPDNKLPIRFRLSTTVEEVLDSCGPDTYRIYAVDDVGKVLDFVTELDLNEEPRRRRNAGAETYAVSRTPLHVGSSDLRYLLDAIVQMMNANGESLRAVNVAQADWIKSIASSRGFFRNGLPPTPPEPPRREERVDEEDDNFDDSEVELRPKNIYDVLTPIAEQIAPAVGPLVTLLTSGAMNANTSSPPAEHASASTDLASRPWEMRDLIDLRYAADKANARKAARSAKDQPEAAVKRSLQARVMSDPKLLAHFMAISKLLADDERAALIELASRLSDLEQDSLLAEIRTLPVADAATLLRALVIELNPTASETSSKSEQ